MEEMSTEAIMKLIQIEVSKRKKNTNRAENNSSSINYTDNPYVPYYKEPIIPLQKVYDIGDFLRYSDEYFVKNAIRGILQREPSIEEINSILPKLRSGKYNKTYILGRLRLTKEGKIKAVKINNLWKQFFLRLPMNFPIVGPVFRLLWAFARLPKLSSYIEMIEQSLIYRGKNAENNLINQINSLMDIANSKINYINSKLGNMNPKLENIILNAQKLEQDYLSLNHTVRIEMEQKIKQVKESILEQERNLKNYLINGNEENATKNSNDLQNANPVYFTENSLYASFEDNFRGSEAEIKERLKVYLPYIKTLEKASNSSILDIGCGRGEWLSLLKENEFHAKGIDINSIMVKRCREQGLEVEESNFIDYLNKIKNDSLDLITGFHIVEHLSFSNLIHLLDESFRTLKKGGIVIWETPNPENVIVGSCNFYIDPTHKSPIPPVTLKFLLEKRGFSKVEILRLNAFPVLDDSNIPPELKKLSIYYNIGMDYSVVGYKN